MIACSSGTSALTPVTRALMPAHMFSVMPDMPRMREIAARYQPRLVEDSAVAQGAVLDHRPAGLWGEAGVFSFVQVKIFGTAGAAVTADPRAGARRADAAKRDELAAHLAARGVTSHVYYPTPLPLPRSAHTAKNTNDQHRLHHACASRLPCHGRG